MVLTEEERRDRRKEHNRKAYEKNKEKMNQNMKEYHEKNKEKMKQNMKEYREKNKEKIKEYRETNKEKIKEYEKEYNQTDACKKSRRISKWKNRGVECEDFNVLYDYYINCKNCEECKVELTVDRYPTSTTRCLDHDHETNQFRNVVCNSCNVKRK